MQCPQCGAKDNFEMWESVNTDLNPDLKTKILSRELFQWICPKCKHNYTVEYPMLYHDMSRKRLIEFRPTSENEQRDTGSNPALAIFQRMGYSIQYAYSIEELISMVKK